MSVRPSWLVILFMLYSFWMNARHGISARGCLPFLLSRWNRETDNLKITRRLGCYFRSLIVILPFICACSRCYLPGLFNLKSDGLYAFNSTKVVNFTMLFKVFQLTIQLLVQFLFCFVCTAGDETNMSCITELPAPQPLLKFFFVRDRVLLGYPGWFWTHASLASAYQVAGNAGAHHHARPCTVL